MSKKKKFYTVWEGREPGVYDNWNECKKQVDGFEGAKYKSFESLKEANEAFLLSWKNFIGNISPKIEIDYKALPPNERPILDSIAVDAACSGNPGMMEYQGVDVKTGYQIFHYGPVEQGTNNIGEFLAIVHALALFYKNNPNLAIYSDSHTALLWVKNRKTRTRLEPTEANRPIFALIQRAEKWLQENTYTNPVLKWDTEKWGEIPADFGRK